MNRQPVTSGNIKTVGYDEAEMLLEIEFSSNAVYRYTNVPKDIYEAFMRSASLGHYFAVTIRASYPCERIHLETCGKYLECTAPNCECWCHKVRKDVTNGRTQENEARTGSVPQGKTKAPSKAKAKKRQPI